MNEKPKYTVEGHRKATMGVSIRTIAALYLAYLGWGVAKESSPDGPLKPWMGWGVFALFLVCAAAIGYYAYRQYKADLKAAEAPAEALPDDSAEEDGDDPEQP